MYLPKRNLTRHWRKKTFTPTSPSRSTCSITHCSLKDIKAYTLWVLRQMFTASLMYLATMLYSRWLVNVTMMAKNVKLYWNTYLNFQPNTCINISSYSNYISLYIPMILPFALLKSRWVSQGAEARKTVDPWACFGGDVEATLQAACRTWGRGHPCPGISARQMVV